jgi:hypothetical protein
MTLEELKNGMREYFKKYKSQMTSEERDPRGIYNEGHERRTL